MKPLVDVFVPTISNHMPLIRRAFACLSFQDYSPLRTVLWIEDANDQYPQIEQFLNDVWYEPHERKPSPKTSDVPVSVEYCAKGVLARNFQGRAGNAWQARQWIFEWEGKSDFVKMLDDDDVMMPSTISVMMQYMTDDMDAVFHPLVGVSSNRLGNVSKGITGAAQMLMRKRTMDRIVGAGFRWDVDHDDGEFYQFFKAQDFKYVVTREDALYFYLK